MKEEFPISKRFSYQELKTQFSGIESALQLREPTGFQSFSASFKGVFGGSKIFKWDELLQLLASDVNESADYINNTIGNILSVSADIKQEPVELVIRIDEHKKAQHNKVQQKKVQQKTVEVKKTKKTKKVTEEEESE